MGKYNERRERKGKQMKLNVKGIITLENDADLCIKFFDYQKDAEGWPCFFDVKFVISVNGKCRASSYSFAGILEEEFAIRRRFPFAEKLEIRMIRIQNDDPCVSGAVVLPEFLSLIFKDEKTAILDGVEWNMRFKSVKKEAESKNERVLQ